MRQEKRQGVVIRVDGRVGMLGDREPCSTLDIGSGQVVSAPGWAGGKSRKRLG